MHIFKLSFLNNKTSFHSKSGEVTLHKFTIDKLISLSEFTILMLIVINTNTNIDC